MPYPKCQSIHVFNACIPWKSKPCLLRTHISGKTYNIVNFYLGDYYLTFICTIAWMHRQCGEIISEGTDPEWKSPTVRCRRTRRHSAWCTGYERCSRAPSTSEEETSADKHSLFSQVVCLIECVDFIVLYYSRRDSRDRRMYVRCLWRCSCCHAWCLWPVQSHRSWPVCPHRSRRFLLPDPDAHTDRQTDRKMFYLLITY